MIKTFTLKKNVLLLLLLLGSIYGQSQTVWTGAVNANWNTAGNWFPAVAPTSTTDVVIPGSLTTYPLVNGFDGIADCNNITINAGGTVVVDNNGNGKLRVYGAITNNGVLDITDGTLIMAGNM